MVFNTLQERKTFKSTLELNVKVATRYLVSRFVFKLAPLFPIVLIYLRPSSGILLIIKINLSATLLRDKSIALAMCKKYIRIIYTLKKLMTLK